MSSDRERLASSGVEEVADVLREAAAMFARELGGLAGASPFAAFGGPAGAAPAPLEDRAPLLRCVAPVAPGYEAHATLRLANDGPVACEAALYTTNFVSDRGSEIPAMRVVVTPRRTTIAPKGEATFEITIAVPAQTPPGGYSGLIQATGAQYTKAVLTVEVT
jgi:hypothetical protein